MEKVLIIGPLSPHSGNLTTAERIRSHIVSTGRECLIAHINRFCSATEFNQFISVNEIQCVLAIHAIKSSGLLQGTDVSGHSKASAEPAVLARLILNARCLITFTETMINSAVTLWPEINRSSVYCIPQALTLSILESEILSDTIRRFTVSLSINGSMIRNGWRLSAGLSADNVIITLVAGIRPVKDPLFLVKAFSDWHVRCRQEAVLVIIGPEVDKEYCVDFHRVIDRLPGVLYTGALPRDQTHGIMSDSFGVVNTSESEGMCMAILEAIYLEVPVIARNIPANAHLIEDGRTGFLCSTPQDFIKRFEELLENSAIGEKLVTGAKDRLELRHSCLQEKQKYSKIIATMSSFQTPALSSPEAL